MNPRTAIALLGLVLAGVPALARALTPIEQTLKIDSTEQAFVLSVPVSRLALRIPRGGFEVELEPGQRSTASPRYFHLRDRGRGIELSGWFESAGDYKGFTDFWDGEIKAWVKGGVPSPATWTLLNVGRWEAALYDIALAPGSAHVRAEWIESGTWIDLHISVTTRDSMESKRAMVLEVLKGLAVTQTR